MNNSIYLHETRGDFDIVKQQIRLNYKALSGDPIQTQLTLFHEWTHRLLADTDFGQASRAFYILLPEYTKLTKNEVVIIGNLLYDNEKFVQEGFATFIQYGRLLNLKDHDTAELWRTHAVNPEYKRYLDELLFVFDYTQEERDLFSGKVSYLVMETGIRKKAVEQNVFREGKVFEDFISDPNNNPNDRLHKVTAAIKADKTLLYKTFQDIAKAGGITYNVASTKEEVAEFLNYVTSFTPNTRQYTIADVVDAPTASDAITQSMDKLVVANLSLNLQESSTVEFEHSNFLHYADKFEVVFVNHHNDQWKHWEFAKSQAKRNPDTSLIAFLPTGDKIVTYATKDEASDLLNNQLKHVTFISHWSYYNATANKLLWSDTVRQPNVIVYDTTENMGLMLKAIANTNNTVKFTHIHSAMMEKHPLQSLFVKIGDETPIHIVNHFENKNIVNLINIIRDRSNVMEKDYVLANKKHINNLLSSWMGLWWEVDWVEGMFDPDVPHFRT